MVRISWSDVVVFLVGLAVGGAGGAILPQWSRSSEPTTVRTIRVLDFKNNIKGDPSLAGLEVELTRALVREIEAKTPYKVVATGDADMELRGVLTGFSKSVLKYNQLNENREVETTLTARVIFRDLRTGESLFKGEGEGALPSMTVRSVAHYRPELGESIDTARQKNINRMAVQIVSLMETPW